MLQTSLQCSLLLVQDTTVFPRANALNANYLFHGQSHDLGDGTLGCGRRSDAVKLFLGWKYYGKLGYQSRIEKSLFNVARFVELLAQDDFRDQRIQMLRLGSDTDDEIMKAGRDGTQPSLLQVCFWYRPRGSRKIDWRGTERVRKDLREPSPEVSSQTASAAKSPQPEPTDLPYLAAGAALDSPANTSTSTDVVSPSTSAISLVSSSSVCSSSSSVATTATCSTGDNGTILTDPKECDEAKAWMERVTKAVHAQIRGRGRFMIDFAPLGPYLPVFFRVVLNPPTIRELDLIQLVDEILECGEAAGDAVPMPEACREA